MFRNKTQIQKWLRATKMKYKAGDRLLLEDEEIFLVLLTRHHSYVEKVGVGVAHVFVDWNATGDTEYRLKRIDGSDVPVGITRLVEAKEYTSTEKLLKACRAAVKPSTDRYRNDPTTTQCCQLCSSTEMLQVDHHAGHRTFLSIFEEWIEVHEVLAAVTDADFKQEKSAPHSFADEAVAEHFRVFHDARAVLRMLCRKCNLGRAGRVA